MPDYKYIRSLAVRYRSSLASFHRFNRNHLREHSGIPFPPSFSNWYPLPSSTSSSKWFRKPWQVDTQDEWPRVDVFNHLHCWDLWPESCNIRFSHTCFRCLNGLPVKKQQLVQIPWISKLGCSGPHRKARLGRPYPEGGHRVYLPSHSGSGNPAPELLK